MAKNYKTELELRQAFALACLRWCGIKEGSEEHEEILELYNAIRPLPRGYKMTTKDAWCAAFISAIVQYMGLHDIMPVECSCTKLIALAKEMGIWEEDDAYAAQVGDWVLYDWQDSGSGDNLGAPDHVGVVIFATDGMLWVVEGNYSNSVKIRELRADGRCIRGFICPDYAKHVGNLVGEELDPIPVPLPEPEQKEETEMAKTYKTVDEVPEYARPTVAALVDRGLLLGVAEGDLGLTDEMVRILTILNRAGAFGGDTAHK